MDVTAINKMNNEIISIIQENCCDTNKDGKVSRLEIIGILDVLKIRLIQGEY